MLVSQLDAENYFVCQCDDYGGPMPHGCIAADLPPLPWEKVWARWSGKAFEMVPDHRERRVEEGFAPELVQAATDYWLPSEGDTHQSSARKMTERGPLPEGAVTERPVKTAEEEAKEQEAQLRVQLDEIDRKSARPLRALAAGTATDEDRAMLASLETEAASLRAGVRALAV